jgi:hypothetical protein
MRHRACREHPGQLITYACAARAALAVWVVADQDPVFCAEHLETFAELNTQFAGHRQFRVVTVTLESQRRPTLIPHLRQIDLVTAIAGPAVLAAALAT